jgi:pyridoxal phosphate enzyme (YggS family)
MNDKQSYEIIRKNFEIVNERIFQAAISAGRSPEEVQLIVVTKGHSLKSVYDVIRAGANKLGENYVDEALPKILATSANSDLEWHMIGHVQSRKARLVSEHFKWVHSLHSIKLANRLERFVEEQKHGLSALIEVNVSGEESKFGYPALDQIEWEKLAMDLHPVLSLSNIRVRGLMTMPPYSPDPEEVRPYFHKLCQLQEYLAKVFPSTEWGELSMGMSNDFEVAIQEGSTMVRIGQAILGPRQKN